MNGSDCREPDSRIPVALAKMKEALGLLDDGGAPGNVGSHLDLAITRLEAWLVVKPRRPQAVDLLAVGLAADDVRDA